MEEVERLQALLMAKEKALRKIADLAEDVKKDHENRIEKGEINEGNCVAVWGLEKILSVALRELESGEK
jgi:hypothetical protein